MKKVAIFGLVVLMLAGCTASNELIKPGKNMTGVNSNNLGQALKKDYSKDLSGRWIWQAKKDKKVIGIGEFEIQDNQGKIIGVSKSLITGLTAVPGKGGNGNVRTAIMVFRLQGTRQGKDKLRFEVKDDNNQSTMNEAVLKKQGTMMEGISKQKLSAEDAKILHSSISDFTYTWTAVRLIEVTKKGM